MNYPTWEVPVLGGGMVIALIATIHILIAHFAVGAGIFVALTEEKIHRKPDPVLKDFLKRFAGFLVLFSFIAGAVTGVGIWFAIGLVSPRATSILIHNYVWGWAAEWCLFLIEIAAGYVYYMNIDRFDSAMRRKVAWIYAIAAWGSLVIINGILTFMLTPGTWIETHKFWDGFFNPTYWPSLILRTISCLSIAGIFVAIVANLVKDYDREKRTVVINWAAYFLLPLVLMLPAAGWFMYELPDLSKLLLKGGAIAMMMFFAFGVVSSTLIGFYAYIGLIRNKRYINLETAILLAAIAFIATGTMEFVREGVRKPFLIHEYLYSSNWTVEEFDDMNTKGVLAHHPWLIPEGRTADDLDTMEKGSAMYQALCAQCHVLDGVNDVKPLIATWNRELLAHNLPRIDKLKPYMPPLVGTPEERAALEEYLWSLIEEMGFSTDSAATHSEPDTAAAPDHSEPRS